MRLSRTKPTGRFTEAYGKQLDDIGQMLVQAGILKAVEVRRQGVRFALREVLSKLSDGTSVRLQRLTGRSR